MAIKLDGIILSAEPLQPTVSIQASQSAQNRPPKAGDRQAPPGPLGTSVALAAVLVAGVIVTLRTITRPDLQCGPGMVAGSSSGVCVGVNLTSSQISLDYQPKLDILLGDVKKHNDAVSDTNYMSIVLLLNLSPITGVDTFSYDGIYENIEGALTGVWRANHTGAFTGSTVPGEEPKIKLFLANMGSLNADWEKAVDQIAAHARAYNITSVVGLGQSTDNTKLKGFFRVSPTNSDTVYAAAHSGRGSEETPCGRPPLHLHLTGHQHRCPEQERRAEGPFRISHHQPLCRQIRGRLLRRPRRRHWDLRPDLGRHQYEPGVRGPRADHCHR